MLELVSNQPKLRLSYKSKNKAWRKQNIEFADNKMLYDRNLIRLDFKEKTILEDLVNGKLHMDDVIALINPELIKAKFIPNSILHFPIINSKINLLIGEELRRVDLWTVKVSNPNAISEIEQEKKLKIFESLLQEVLNESLSEEEFNLRILKLNDYYLYEYLDLREIRANCLLNHYNKEQDHKMIFNNGFRDAITVGEELYRVDVVGGEPILEKLTPKFVKIYRNGYSHKVEDADMIIITDYMSIGLIYDEFYDVLTKKDLDYLEEQLRNFATGNVDEMDNWDERKGFAYSNTIPSAEDVFGEGDYWDDDIASFLPIDANGNFRVLRVYWKSQRKIKKIKFYDPETGEEDFTFMTEDYIPNESMGEEELTYWINEAWEGVKIGENIIVNVRPKPIQFNRLSNPSRCHFGIIGTIYSFNNGKPFSLVSMAKPFSYYYDVIHDRLNKLMARNWGKMTRLNLALKPSTWDVDKWLYYAKTMGLYVEDGFNEGNIGAATGKIAGAMNMNSNGVIDADFGNNIQLYINLLEYIKQEMSDAMGISKLREGLISNRETVGGVERSTLLSSHITEAIFALHDATKKRVREAFLEVCKVALKGKTKKFQNILPDYSTEIIEIDGDEFAESDYGVLIDNSEGLLELQQKLETLALAALQNQTLSFSTITKLFSSASLAEKLRFIETDEKRIQEQRLQELLQLQQMQEQQILAQLLQKLQEMQFKDLINLRDNETKIMVAEINSQAEMAILQLKNHMTEEDLYKQDLQAANNLQKLENDMAIIDKKIELEKEKIKNQNKLFDLNLRFLQDKAKKDLELKLKQINKSVSSKK